MKKSIFFIIILVIGLLIIFSISKTYLKCNNMSNLPVGDIYKTIYSPNEQTKINIYRYSSHATVDFFMRIEYEDIYSGDKRNIFYGEKVIDDIKWLDEENIMVGKERLNVHTDSYHYLCHFSNYY